MKRTPCIITTNPKCYHLQWIANEILMHFRNQRKCAQDVFISDPIDTDKEGNSLTLQDIMSDDDNIFDHIDLRLKSEQLYKFIDRHLSEREKKIVIMRYGLFCTKPLTQREVADTLGISRSYVSQRAYENHVSASESLCDYAKALMWELRLKQSKRRSKAARSLR